MASRYSGVGIYASKIKCGDCGGWYGSKVWHSNSKYRKIIYQCNRKFKNECKCSTPHLSEDEIQTAFVKAANIAIDEREELIANAKLMMDMVCDTSEQRAQSQKLLTELDILVERIQKLVHDNARIAMDQIEYQRQYDELERRYNKAKGEYDEAMAEITELQKREDYFKQFIATLEDADELIREFDEGMWCSMVESMTVHRKDNIVFTFVGGMEVAI